MLHEGGAQPHG